MRNVRNEMAKLAALAVIAMLTIPVTRAVGATTVLTDEFERTGELNASAPTLGSGLWTDPGVHTLTTGDKAFLTTPGNNSRANYPAQLADGEVHIFTIDVDVVDEKGTDWAAVGFAWNIDSHSTTTGTGPWIFLRSEDSDFDMASFTLAGSGRREHSFGEGPLAGQAFTNAGTIQVKIDARGDTDTVEFAFNGISLGDPQALSPSSLNNIDGVFLAGTSQAFFDNAQLVSVPEPTALALAVIGLLAVMSFGRAGGRG